MFEIKKILIPITGTPQRLTITGWVLAAIIILFYNGHELSAFLKTEQIGHSERIEILKDKREALIKRMSTAPEALDEEAINHIGETFAATADKSKIDGMEPPRLAGILVKTRLDAGIDYFVLIEGQYLKMNDVVRGFKIQTISEKGAALSKLGRRFFVPATDIYYAIEKTAE